MASEKLSSTEKVNRLRLLRSEMPLFPLWLCKQSLEDTEWDVAMAKETLQKVYGSEGVPEQRKTHEDK